MILPCEKHQELLMDSVATESTVGKQASKIAWDSRKEYGGLRIGCSDS
jgi:hypothetical protein